MMRAGEEQELTNAQSPSSSDVSAGTPLAWRSAVPAGAPARIALGATLGVAIWLLWSTLGLADAAGLRDTWEPVAGAVIGGALGAAGRLRVLAATGAVLAAALLIVAYTPVAPSLARGLVRADSARGTEAQAVVVLGAEITADGLAVLTGLERALSGLALTSPGDSRTLVFSVIRIVGDTVTGLRDIERLVALAGGRRLAWLNNVYSTRDEAVELHALAVRRGWHTVVVVTSPSHSRRACATFERTGLRVICRPSEGRSARLSRAATPRERLSAWRYVVYERLGSILYRWRGWT